MKRNWILVLLGVTLFVIAFFLVAAREAKAAPTDKGLSGYTCALITIELPWSHDGVGILRSEPLMYFSILFSGWINPLFLITLVWVLINPASRIAGTLRIVVLVMFAACWLVFFKEHLHPQTGYFLWMFGILLALFAPRAGAPQARV